MVWNGLGNLEGVFLPEISGFWCDLQKPVFRVHCYILHVWNGV